MFFLALPQKEPKRSRPNDASPHWAYPPLAIGPGLPAATPPVPK
ncbi:MAG: hypothetical protein AVDCRST_MAG56-7464 [uncultured Cytophagales bacterium]|uniref:Uncharacterized protein n=1 Tax=uncultured Cytophagales bacterium TaxID=158755 RepID=A0A6J4LGV5_9SPHI|nr:MAG: hypothetical protein AVDCRST_MAG56-7464 [uncultured Cytophagales bacterium]